MFDAQSLLGGLLKSVTGDNQPGGKAALGMGALGIAIAAYEHFTQESKQTKTITNRPPAPATSNNQVTPPPISAAPPSTPSAAPPSTLSAAPPSTLSAAPPSTLSAAPPSTLSAAPPSTPSAAPPSTLSAAPPSAPPVAPPSTSTIAPPPMPATSTATATEQSATEQALLLIDAMLAAANADGEIDSSEELKIMQQLKDIGSDQEGFDYMETRLNNPPSMQQICERVNDLEMAEKVYMVSLIAIVVDTEEEAEYLKDLAANLKLDSQTINRINQQFLVEEE
ncbi:MAG: DUF533 domain-containing protein [Pseudomonadota bacterium]